MSWKDKQAIPKDTAKASKAVEKKMMEKVKSRRGIEPEETHREGGNRVPDQGSHKK